MDDRILKAHWSGRTEWANNPLQLELYQENSAGEGFYARLHALLVRAETAAALEIYYLCLALGFTGASRGGADAEQQMKAVAKRLPSLPLSEPIGPNALAKDHRPLQVLPRTLFGFVAILAVVALLVSEGLMVVSMYSAIREAQSLLQSSGFVGLAGGLRP
jgi:type VI secretion system protein ImpK